MIYRRFHIAAALSLAVLTLTACQQESQPAPSANPEAKPGLSVDGGSLVLPAVKGNPGAAYFAITNAGVTAAEVAAIHIDGAEKVEIHETKGSTMEAVDTVKISPGATVKFERGALHAMAFGMGDTLVTDGTTEMTVIFSDGDKLSAPLAIRSAADADDHEGMAGMDHGASH